ncbi:MAG: beta-propeller fold lactonase family protein [Planctomycetes bacterium]|nr:beta-propeller fold lactonase family protein [Planctomycetota bacterium]
MKLNTHLSLRFALALSIVVAAGCDPLHPFACTESHSVQQAPPSIFADFDYARASMREWVGVSVAPNLATLNVGGGSFTIAPALPAGMTLDPLTGAIAGTPQAPSAATSYTVTATFGSSSGFSDTTQGFSLEIFDAVAPTAFAYQPSSIVVLQGHNIAPIAPQFTGAVQSFAVAPALPQGLQFDAVLGTISGTCSAPVGKTQHVVTATNPIGSAQAGLEVEVVAAPQLSGVLVGSRDDQTLDVFEARGAALTPIDSEYLLGASPIATALSIDGRSVYVSADDGHVYREALDVVSGLTSPPTDLGSFGIVWHIVPSPDGADLYLIKDFAVERWSLQPDGSLCCPATLAGPFGPSAALAVSQSVLMVAAAAPGSVQLYDLAPNFAPRGQPLNFAADITVRALANVKPGKFVVAATSRYDSSTHFVKGITRSLKLATDVELASGNPAIVEVDNFVQGGDLTSVAAVGSNGDEVLLCDLSNASLLRFGVDAAGKLLPLVAAGQPATFVVGGTPEQLLVSPDGTRVYVLDVNFREIGVHDLTAGALKLVARVRTRGQPSSMVPLFRALPQFEPDVAFATSATDATLVAVRAGATTTGELASTNPIATGATPMDVAVSSGGPFVYTADRDGASISAFRFDTAPLQLAPIETEDLGTGARPRSLAITRGGAFLYALDESLGVRPYAIDASDGSLAPAGTTVVGGDLTDALARVDVLGRFLFVVQPNEGRVTTLSINLPSGFTLVTTTFSGAARPIDLWLSLDGRFAYVLDQELGSVIVCAIDVVSGNLLPTGASFSLGGSPTQLVDARPIEWAYPGSSANNLLVPDLVNSGVDALDRNLLTGALAANSGFPGSLPQPDSIVRALRLGAGLDGFLVASDDGVNGHLHTLERDPTTHAFVELDQTTLGRAPHALAVHTRLVP